MQKLFAKIFNSLQPFHYTKNSTLDVFLAAWKVSKYGVISGLYFPVFGLNTEIYRPNTGKYGLEIAPYLDTFHAVSRFYMSISIIWIFRLFITEAWRQNLFNAIPFSLALTNWQYTVFPQTWVTCSNFFAFSLSWTAKFLKSFKVLWCDGILIEILYLI